ncbi:hypothetical protein Htur_5077 (plasmid) [Haloterrigena turkmenica DSM 5511]|uniref:Uncharacterized protein n=1 Tax=Haloterrigena turkmenica (strain ATCC 51198 / DSM 5511 / JCM 9101 / NCIMB 13204 / VKM B-1734 / 4k) TaxID=543526 RepID=D2S3L7_HALTV|nr:hypothetical protein [Haloterrigena turkmenica]ADB63964.1 hypothetical protein Htur_5077 [Haloterrigena turkmenica DSM 5511]
MSTFKTLLTEEIDVAGRPAAALTDRFEDESELVDAFREDVSFTDYSGVGRRTSQKLWDYLTSEYPEADRERKERSDSICTEYTTDHELPDETLEDGLAYWAFICPRCENTNPLKGDPEDFESRPFRCETCRWVSRLEKESLREFAEDELAEETEVPA